MYNNQVSPTYTTINYTILLYYYVLIIIARLMIQLIRVDYYSIVDFSKLISPT